MLYCPGLCALVAPVCVGGSGAKGGGGEEFYGRCVAPDYVPQCVVKNNFLCNFLCTRIISCDMHVSSSSCVNHCLPVLPYSKRMPEYTEF